MARPQTRARASTPRRRPAAQTAARRSVYAFGGGKADGRADMKELLGGKGANLAEMARLALPVPPGFTISTEVCTYYYTHGNTYPPALKKQVGDALARVEKVLDKRFGDPEHPLLVSVRSGARASMPGMMDTILNLGLNDQTVEGLIRETGNARFAYDSYRRFVQMYGDVVLGLKPRNEGGGGSVRDRAPGEEARARRHPGHRARRRRAARAGARVQGAHQDAQGHALPRGPAGAALGRHRRRLRLVDERPGDRLPQAERHPRELGHRGQRPVDGLRQHGSRLGHRRRVHARPLHRRERLLRRVPDECAGRGRGRRHPHAAADPRARAREPEGLRPAAEGAAHARAPLPRRHGHRVHDPAGHAVHAAVPGREAHRHRRRRASRSRWWTSASSRRRRRCSGSSPSGSTSCCVPCFDSAAKKQAERDGRLLARGLNAGPGAATGAIAFHAEDAEALAGEGKRVILVRNETSPEDIRGMAAAEGILTARGGMTSHAALVGRQMGKVCVVGCDALQIDYEAGTMRIAGRDDVLEARDPISIDGFTGEVFRGEIPTRPSDVVEVIVDHTRDAKDSPTYQLYARLMEWADKVRSLGVRANADLPEQCALAIAFGAEGVGLCRTEHMFFGEGKIGPMRQMILAETSAERRAALANLLPLQRADFRGIFQVLGGRPVTIRTIDPPLHEFLPHDAEGQAELAAQMGIPAQRVRARVEALHEFNPMLGFRGCRLGIVFPEITEMQARAIFEAAADVKAAGGEVRPEVMIPLVGHVKELQLQAEVVRRVAGEVMQERGVRFAVPRRHHDRGPARRAHRRRHRRGRRVLLLRHQRPDADHPRRLARRRGPLPDALRQGVRDLSARSVRIDRSRRRRRADARGGRTRPEDAAASSRSASAASTAATRPPSRCVRSSSWTTSRARPSGCPSRASPRRRPPCGARCHFQPRLFGVLGDPVDHSLSPAMHNAGFAACGLPHLYLRWRVSPGELRQALREARRLGRRRPQPHRSPEGGRAAAPRRSDGGGEAHRRRQHDHAPAGPAASETTPTRAASPARCAGACGSAARGQSLIGAGGSARAVGRKPRRRRLPRDRGGEPHAGARRGAGAWLHDVGAPGATCRAAGGAAARRGAGRRRAGRQHDARRPRRATRSPANIERHPASLPGRRSGLRPAARRPSCARRPAPGGRCSTVPRCCSTRAPSPSRPGRERRAPLAAMALALRSAGLALPRRP